MAKEKIRPSSLMMVDVDDLRELVQSEIEGVLAMEKRCECIGSVSHA